MNLEEEEEENFVNFHCSFEKYYEKLGGEQVERKMSKKFIAIKKFISRWIKYVRKL